MTARPIAAHRAVALMAFVVLSLVATLTLSASPAVADTGSMAGTGVAAFDLDHGDAVGSGGAVVSGEGRETAGSSYDNALGCCVATKSSAGSTVLRNKKQGDAFRDEIADLLRRAGRDVVTDETHKNLLTYWTPYGLRTLDIGVWRDSGGLDYVETKSGDAKYEGDKLLKDDWLRGHGLTIDVCFER